jgi:hypothetical protein
MSDQRLQALSQHIEALLVRGNPRQMATLRGALKPGYCLRAAQRIAQTEGPIWICTGFPVANRFETDGPVGAIALFDTLVQGGKDVRFLGGEHLLNALALPHKTWQLSGHSIEEAEQEATELFGQEQPALLIVIERPGACADGRFYNISGRDITAVCHPFEPYLQRANCPVIAIGDGGNEVGMGKLAALVATLGVTPVTSDCDELIVADVSNWGAYGILCMLSQLGFSNAFATLQPRILLASMVAMGAVDGITHKNEPTEDGFSVDFAERLLRDMGIAVNSTLNVTPLGEPVGP